MKEEKKTEKTERRESRQVKQISTMTHTQTQKTKLPAVSPCNIYTRGVKQTW